ncbi:MAG: hypothetical protein AUK34_00310 [Ignavibacteria bacterium CG2_30_36_16]|nr:MAG: hypothetical protein AUK34_00310 [Ignavibacteria bacterium CG2_30_36_16]PJB00528.1 MAG: hypothetical protein CO127_08090 [Ignavibacteria bacterium CG_4_9_14_3_um_filter_36_18]
MTKIILRYLVYFLLNFRRKNGKLLKTFRYSIFYRLVYKYANIPLTIFLALYLIYWGAAIDKHIIYLLPFLFTLLIVYFLNKHYLLLYKIMPFKIEADDEKLICSKFFMSKKVRTIYFNNIEKLEGGLFEGKPRGIMRLCDGQSKVWIGIYQNIINGRELGTLILSKVQAEVYNSVLEKINKQTKSKRV